MNEKVKVPNKISESEKNNSTSGVRESDVSLPLNSPVDKILFLQRTIGNQAVQRMIKSGTIRTRLRTCRSEDIKEQLVQTKVFHEHITPLIQSQEGQEREEEEETVQTKSIQTKMRNGHPLDSRLRSRMESAFGTSFSHVRAHIDTRAAELSDSLNARAVTLGKHIAFGIGEYRPGTPIGDALIAHELAHVVQQQGGATSPAVTVQKAETEDHALEHDADRSAVTVATSLWGGTKGMLPDIIPNARPRLKSGLRLQRCGRSRRSQTSVSLQTHQYVWQDQALRNMVNGSEGAEEINLYINGLDPAAREQAIQDFVQGRINYVRRFRSLNPQSDEARSLHSSIVKMDAVLSGFYGQVAMTQAPHLRATSTEYPVSSTPPELFSGTHQLTDTERQAIREALTPTPDIDPRTGRAPRFRRWIDGRDYVDELRRRIEYVIDDQYNRFGRRSVERRAGIRGVHDWSHIQQIAERAKTETDQVFGSYATGDALRPGNELRDRWERQETELARMTPDQQFDTALWRVEKILRENRGVEAINRRHNAIRTRSRERRLIEGLRLRGRRRGGIKGAIARARLRELLEIQRGWPASADPETGQVFIQRFRQDTDRENKVFLWRTFQQLIHEYIHTLAHSAYRNYYNSLPSESEHTLKEGMTDVLTKIVWNNVDQNDRTLRETIEGTNPDPDFEPPLLSVYPQTRNAEEVVAIVGIRNVYAAYFLGHTELIGRV
jgi:hypothetical protein